MTLALGQRSSGSTPAARRRAALAAVISLGLNALLIGALLLIDRPTTFWSARPAPLAALQLGLFRVRAETPQTSIRQNATGRPTAALARKRPAGTTSLPARTVAPTEPPSPDAPPSAATPAQPGADEATRARVSEALRRMSACARSGDDQDRADCAAQLAVRRDEEINAVPAEMRAKQASADARRAYVMSGAAASQLPGGRQGDHGLSASVHYECSMKFGVGASGGPHCPGVRQLVQVVQRATN